MTLFWAKKSYGRLEEVVKLELEHESDLERNVLQDDDGVLGRILLQQCLEVRRASREDHLVSLARLSIASLEMKVMKIWGTHSAKVSISNQAAHG